MLSQLFHEVCVAVNEGCNWCAFDLILTGEHGEPRNNFRY